MRRCLVGDLLEAAALVAASPGAERQALVERLLEQADAAHRYAKRFGHAHPDWGNGSLMSRALAEPSRPRPPFHSEAFLSAISLLAHHLASRKKC